MMLHTVIKWIAALKADVFHKDGNVTRIQKENFLYILKQEIYGILIMWYTDLIQSFRIYRIGLISMVNQCPSDL